jgi:hypothetical protein
MRPNRLRHRCDYVLPIWLVGYRVDDLAIGGPLVEAAVILELRDVHVPFAVVTFVYGAAPTACRASGVRSVQPSTDSSGEQV